ncbi:MAG: hypothetical protein GQ570_13770 [Helicobacteraceae bacterium]|nr:hypothetical protein [Helicobacteraceae bacterium]
MSKEKKLLKHGFNLEIEVLQPTTIQGGGSGEVNGNSYSHSCKFRSSNILAYNDPQLGVIEKETIIEIRIVCANDEEVRAINEHIYQMRDLCQAIS